MFNLYFRSVGIISLLLLYFVSMFCVCAHDVGLSSIGSNIYDLNQENSVDVSGHFSELNNDLCNLFSGDTYNFNKDY